MARLDLDDGLATVSDATSSLTTRQLLETEINFDSGASEQGTVAICFRSALDFVKAVVALDGKASGLLLLSPDLDRQQISSLLASSGTDTLITDRDDLAGLSSGWSFVRQPPAARGNLKTTWLMTTSGTTGLPKIVAHTLGSLTASLRASLPTTRPTWGLLYDPSRFAGVQVILHALLGASMLVAADRQAPFGNQIEQLIASGCTHLSATTAMWRKILMLPLASNLPLKQVTMGGDIADARTLKALALAYPAARITHIYASTEIGVGFSVHDGLPGFPLSYLEPGVDPAQFKIRDGMLWARPAASVVESQRPDALPSDEQGYIRTGDLVEIVDQRAFFRGRNDTVANIGGVKVAIETVEDIVRQHANVLDCQISIKPNPILGAVLALKVVARDPGRDEESFRNDIRNWCKESLPREARPALVSVVADLQRNSAGKIARLL